MNVYEELAKLIRDGFFKHIEEAGLAIQTLVDALEDGETDAMALALAKQCSYAETERAMQEASQ